MHLKPNSILADRFLVRELAKTGGMTLVYRGLDFIDKSDIAIKVFERAEHQPTVLKEAFRREVASLTNLKHPNIVRIRGSGETSENRPYIVLDWLDTDLNVEKEKFSEAFLGWDSFAEKVALPILRALSFAHDRGISHRDIKPSNILMSDEGTVLLADFNIAKLKTELLRPSITLGQFTSRPFSAPESESMDFGYTRDVYSFAAICVWALSDRPLITDEDIQRAASEFNSTIEIRNIIKKALDINPRKRFENAILLEYELLREQQKRESIWNQEGKTVVRLNITNKARQNVANINSSDPEDRTRLDKFIEEDINADSTLENFRSYQDNADCSGQYVVYGGQCSYHIAVDRSKPNILVVLGVREYLLDHHNKLKARAFDSPIEFSCKELGVESLNGDVIHFIESALATARASSGAVSAAEELIHSWSRTLDAKREFAQNQKPPISFKRNRVDGPLVVLDTEADLSSMTFEEPWYTRNSEGIRYSGVVYDIGVGSLTLRLLSRDPEGFPVSGTLRLDIYSYEIALRRQQDAIDAIRDHRSLRADLPDLIANPSRCSPIQSLPTLPNKYGLDQPKSEALQRAISCEDFLVVEGPPGTGKTLFISALVCETIRRNPRARILLSSQTHVAIDNALEKIAELAPEMKIVRIARSGDSRISDSVEQWLPENALHLWKDEIGIRCNSNLSGVIKSDGINIRELQLGLQLKRLEIVRKRIDDTKEKRLQLETKYATARDSGDQHEIFDLEDDERELEVIDEQIKIDEAESKTIVQQLKKDYPECSDLLDLNEEELGNWICELLPDTVEAIQAQRTITLQAEWLERFGCDDTFKAALCESSDLVAATCLGLASVQGAEDVEFDLCIMDEAGKAHATEALVPLVRTRKWVLVGDPRQLPPFEDEALRSQTLLEQFGIDETSTEPLLERLLRQLPDQNKMMLSIQYRMVKPIGDLISDCFYDGKLKTHERQADQRLRQILGANVIWLTTHLLAQRYEEFSAESFINSCEVERILDLLRQLDHQLSDSKRIYSVLCLSGYAAQIRHMSQSYTHEVGSLKNLSVEFNTIDAVQGREADIVIFSVTRNNTSWRGGFLREYRRINVAFSRARETLLIVGDLTFVQKADGLDSLRMVLEKIKQGEDGFAIQQFEDSE